LRDLHIVATCTDRKALAPDPELLVRNAPARPNGAPDVHWWLEARESTSAPSVRADSLYQGELWVETMRTREIAGGSGRRVSLWVASAGYGLVSVDTELKGYGATFSPNTPDSVTRASSDAVGSQRARAWWRALTMHPVDASAPSSVAELARAFAEAELLIVMSGAYVVAVAEDLGEARTEHPRAVLISAGAAQAPEYAGWAPTFDARVQGRGRPLGGTRTSLNVRVAQHVLDTVGPGELDPSSASAAVDELMRGLEPAPSYARRPATDPEVSAFVRSLLHREPGTGHTAALRIFRDVEQRACEQKRFARLYRREKALLEKWAQESLT
jgi:hypothetical protein